MNPSEIQRLYPIGSPIELSRETRFRVKFLDDAIRWVTYIPDAINKKFEGTEPSHDEIKKYIDTLSDEAPAKGMFSMVAGNGWFNNPMSGASAQQFQKVMTLLMWSVIYEDLVKNCGMTKAAWRILNLSICHGAQAIVVKGYNFSDDDLNLKTFSKNDTIDVPDSPTPEMLQDENSDG
jgi:hypothetical protein